MLGPAVRGLALLGLAAAGLDSATAWVFPARAAAAERTEAAQFRRTRPVFQESASEEGREFTTAAQWLRASLAAVAVLAAMPFFGAQPAQAEDGDIKVYFGQGCFWHVQYNTIQEEVKNLGRKPPQWSALTGYAGGAKAGEGGKVCYHNFSGAPDYGVLGFTEVVQVSIPQDKLQVFAKDYIDEANGYMFGRADPQDMGSEYRSAIGIPGGMDGPLFKQVEAANQGRMKFIAGKGADEDTVGSKKVYVYDTEKFPFFQAEVKHQYHDDMMERYPEDYHANLKPLMQSGYIHEVGCPEKRLG